MSHPLSVRLTDATLARLVSRARRVRLPPRTLAQRYVEEGLRMDEHPLIRFAEGPSGRRARIVGTGKDVWEVIAVVRDNDGDAAEAARYLEIPLASSRRPSRTTARTSARLTSSSKSTNRKQPKATPRSSLARQPSGSEAAP